MAGPTVFLDACVLFPTVVRRILLGAAAAGLYAPRWSARVLDEWQIAIARQQGAGAEDEVLAARSAMARDFPEALTETDADIAATLTLPDPGDVHVAAAAAGSDVLLTFNLSDFPRRPMAGLGVDARHPDGFLWELWSEAPEDLSRAVNTALDQTGVERNRLRAVLKRARLPRLGKAIESISERGPSEGSGL